MSDSGTERMKDVERAQAVVAALGDACDCDEGDGVSILMDCDACLTRLIANAISERRMEAMPKEIGR